MSAPTPATERPELHEAATPVIGERMVDTPITCVLTRFGLRSSRFLVPSYLSYRRVEAAAQEAGDIGLLRSAFLLEKPRTWFSLSLWRGNPAFSALVPAHIHAANSVFGHLAFTPGQGPELWSTKWRLVSVTNNLNWDGFDFEALLETRSA